MDSETLSRYQKLLELGLDPPEEALELDESFDFSDKYTDAEALGKGGMGQVLKIRDRSLGRDVAMKLSVSDDPSVLERFIHEAQITAQLEHPNIIPVHELSVDETGRQYFTMKRIEGFSLAQLIERRELGSLIDRLQIFQKICDAISYAHSNGVIHRDIKPENVMIGSFGEVLVVDWGLAKRLSSKEGETPDENPIADPDQTRYGVIKGTPSWMSPEQANGEIELIGAASDIYSLGALLYALLTDRAPFLGDTNTILEAVRRNDFQPPSQTAEGFQVDPELEAIVMRAMALDPNDRYPSVDSLEADIKAFLEGRTLSVIQYSFLGLFKKWYERHRAVFRAVLSTSVIAFLILFVGLVTYISEVRSARDSAVESARRAENEKMLATFNLAKAEAATAELLLGENYVPQARKHWEKAFDLTVSVDRSPRFAELGLAKLASRHPYPDVEFFTGEVSSLALSKDGSKLLTADPSGLVWVFSVPEAKVLAFHTFIDGVTAPKLRSLGWLDGDPYVVWQSGSSLSVVNVRHGQVVDRLDLDPLDIKRVRWPLQKHSLFIQTSGGEMYRWRRDKSHPDLLATPEWFYLRGVSPDGRYLFGPPEPDRYSGIAMWDVETGEIIDSIPEFTIGKASSEGQILFLNEASTDHIAAYHVDSAEFLWKTESKNTRWTVLSGNGHRGVSIDHIGVATVWDIRRGQREFVLPLRLSGFKPIHISHDGRVIVSSFDDGLTRIWQLGKNSRFNSIMSPSSQFIAVDISSNSKLLISGDRQGNVEVWEVESGQRQAILDIGDLFILDVALSDEQDLIAVAGRSGEVFLFRYPGQELLWTVESESTSVFAVEFSPDGERLFCAASEGAFEVRLVEDGTLLNRIIQHTGDVWDLEFDPSGEFFMTTGRGTSGGIIDGTIRVWDAETQEQRLVATSEDQMILFRGAWSPDGRTLAAGRHDGAISLWSLSDPNHPRILSGHDGPVMSVTYCPNGELLASGGYEGSIIIRDTEDSQILTHLDHHTRPVMDLTFSPNGNFLISASLDGTINIWSLTGYQTTFIP